MLHPLLEAEELLLLPDAPHLLLLSHFELLFDFELLGLTPLSPPLAMVALSSSSNST